MEAPSIHSGDDVGQALRALREARGLSLSGLSEITRVRVAYLQALEEMQLDGMPSRPFVVGYIRAYAAAVGADPEVAAQRFKLEEPVLDEPLHAPVGMQEPRDPRLIVIVVAFAIVGAIVAWNVIQRVVTEGAPPPPTASEAVTAKALAATATGPISLGAPLPAPRESTTPPPYVTPGLNPGAREAQPPSPELNLVTAFTPKGTIYGAPGGQAGVVLQALKPAFLVIHGANGSVYFARQLAEGEAYRAPNIPGLTVDVSEPEAFQVFAEGHSRGVLPAPLTPVARLLPPPPAIPANAAPATPPAVPESSPPTVASQP